MRHTFLSVLQNEQEYELHLVSNGVILTQTLNKQLNGVHIHPYISLNTFITQLSS